MPKIITNIREKLLEEAKRQVFEHGYSSLTIRSVANACGVGVGTVYNYFPSKDMLVASFMLHDWQECLEEIEKCSNENASVEDVLCSIYTGLKKFASKYASLFQDENAEVSYAGASSFRHKMLKEQLAKPIERVLIKENVKNISFVSEFMAENMLIWTFSIHDFEEIKELLLKVLL